MLKNRFKFLKIGTFSSLFLICLTPGTFNYINQTKTIKTSNELVNHQNFDIRTYDYVQNPNNLPVYDNTFSAPNYRLIYQSLNPTQIDDIELDSNGWCTVNNSYQKIFLNEEVAKFFAGNSNIDDQFDLQNAKNNLGSKKRLEFSGIYLNDIYADDTIKCLNNPNLNELWNDVLSIDLSSNNLWYIPLFGYQNTQTHSTPSFYTNLKNLNLSNNKITVLPFAKIPTILRNEYYDLTNLSALEENGINLANNLLCEDPRIEPQIVQILYRPAVNHPNKLIYSNENQSSWIYINSLKFSNYINEYYEINNSVSIKNLYVKQKDIGINQEITVGHQITTLLTEWIQKNFLCSNFLFGQDQSELSFLSSNVYLFSQSNNEKGAQMFSTYFKQLQYYDNEKNHLEIKNNAYINFNVSGFKQDNSVEISVIVLSILIIALLTGTLIYQIFIKKYLINKKKAKISKELSEIQNFLSDTRKDSK